MCGIVGIIGQQPVASELYDSLIHLQHRGQDAAGIVTCDHRFHSKRGAGLVREIFNAEDISKLTGNYGLAHARYPTAGTYSADETQPFQIFNPYGIALSHNGNLVNTESLAEKLYTHHQRHLNTGSDSEILLNLFADGLDTKTTITDSNQFFEQICLATNNIMQIAEGSYSIVASIIGKGIIAFRDPHGIRPLVLGERQQQNHTDYIMASETTMFYPLGFEYTGDVQPGEVIFIDLQGKIFRKKLVQKQFAPCIFEYIYFARPDTRLDDVSVYRARLRMGQNLAHQWLKEHPDIKPDVVIPAPFTSNTAALSFAYEIGVRYSEGLYKNPFIGRTFIMPNQQERKRSVRYKLIPQETEIRDKKVLILDDSIVRGTTSKEIISMVREYGAKEVYFVSSCPPVKFPCFYGIDIPTRKELIASQQPLEKVRDYLDADILLYQEIPDLVEAVTRKGKHHIVRPCMACLDGDYISGNINEKNLTKFENKRCPKNESQQTTK